MFTSQAFKSSFDGRAKATEAVGMIDAALKEVATDYEALQDRLEGIVGRAMTLVTVPVLVLAGLCVIPLLLWLGLGLLVT